MNFVSPRQTKNLADSYSPHPGAPGQDVKLKIRVSDSAPASDAGAAYVLFLDQLYVASTYPGTQEDFILGTGLNGMPCTTGPGNDVKAASPADFLAACLSTPNGTLHNRSDAS